MIKRLIPLLLLAFAVNNKVNSQIYYTKNGSISFFSKNVLEDINADNNQVISVLNIETGVIQFSLLNNAFHFQKAKMEEDFNDNYIESDKYPRSTFNGTLTNIRDVNFDRDGSYPVIVNGDLTVHGVTKKITTRSTITINKGNISATASFQVLVKDYKINIPAIVSQKIAENIEVKVACNYQKK
ncbi:MAG: YceI family protein [Ginsengibacter sp.]